MVVSTLPEAVSKSSVCLSPQSALKQPKDFLSLARIERVGQDAARQPSGVTTLREIQTMRTSPPFPRASYVRKGFNFSRATRKVTVLGLAMVFFSLNFYCNDLELTIALIQSNVEPGDVPLIGARETTPVVAAVSQRETVVTAH